MPNQMNQQKKRLYQENKKNKSMKMHVRLNYCKNNQSKPTILISTHNLIYIESKRRKIRKDFWRMSTENCIKNLNHNKKLMRNSLKD